MNGTTLDAKLGSKTSITLKAEVMLLLIITIFGLIGLSFCIGLYGQNDDVSVNYSAQQEINISVSDQYVKT